VIPPQSLFPSRDVSSPSVFSLYSRFVSGDIVKYWLLRRCCPPLPGTSQLPLFSAGIPGQSPLLCDELHNELSFFPVAPEPPPSPRRLKNVQFFAGKIPFITKQLPVIRTILFFDLLIGGTLKHPAMLHRGAVVGKLHFSLILLLHFRGKRKSWSYADLASPLFVSPDFGCLPAEDGMSTSFFRLHSLK